MGLSNYKKREVVILVLFFNRENVSAKPSEKNLAYCISVVPEITSSSLNESNQIVN